MCLKVTSVNKLEKPKIGYVLKHKSFYFDIPIYKPIFNNRSLSCKINETIIDLNWQWNDEKPKKYFNPYFGPKIKKGVDIYIGVFHALRNLKDARVMKASMEDNLPREYQICIVQPSINPGWKINGYTHGCCEADPLPVYGVRGYKLLKEIE